MDVVEQDYTLEFLIDLDGYTVFLERGFWVKFEATKVKKTSSKPFGIKYSLTLHNPEGNRILGFDNAHARPGASMNEPHDHIHNARIRSYHYSNASKLIEDFWKEVNNILKRMDIRL